VGPFMGSHVGFCFVVFVPNETRLLEMCERRAERWPGSHVLRYLGARPLEQNHERDRLFPAVDATAASARLQR